MRFAGHTLEHLVRYSKAEAPREACGLLACKNDHYADGRQEISVVRRFYPIKNIHEDPTSGYILDPKEQLRAELGAARDGLTICGLFHSHPTGNANASDDDQLDAVPNEINLILSVQGENFRAFTMNVEGDFLPTKINGRDIMQVGKPAFGFVPNPNAAPLWRAYVFDNDAEEKMVTYDSTNTAPEDVPDRCVCMLQMVDSATVERVHAEFTVLSHEGRWKGASQVDIDTEISLGTPYAAITEGYWVDTVRWRRMMLVILRDSDFPQPHVHVDGLIEAGII